MGSDSTRRYLSLTAAIALLVILHLFRPGTSSFWLETFFDWLHVPVFALVTIGIFHALGGWRSNVNKAILAFLAALVLAVVSEAAQIPTSRDASWHDIFSNVLGAAIGLLAIPTVTRRVTLKVVSRTLAILLLLISWWPLLGVTTAYVERNRVFPVIFDGVWPSREEFMSQRGMVIDFRNVYPDWRDFRSLAVDIEVQSADTFPLTIRVHDKQHLLGSQPHADRFNRRFVLESGRTVIRIPLADIEAAPAGRFLDLASIDGLVLFSTENTEDHTVRLRRIWLDSRAPFPHSTTSTVCKIIRMSRRNFWFFM